MIKSVLKRWNSYKYRFMPWILVKLPKVNPDRKLLNSDNNTSSKLLDKLIKLLSTNKFDSGTSFILNIKQSNISEAGLGVFITHGSVKKGDIVALYPGTVYMPYDSKIFQSLNNSFMFQCHDHVCIDGKSTGISKSIYKSCGHRDTLGSYKFCDFSWLNPKSSISFHLNVGQFVNNQNKVFQQNVEYQELDVPHKVLPLKLRCNFPNVNYNNIGKTFTRTVVLIATKDIFKGEELFSNYFTVVR